MTGGFLSAGQLIRLQMCPAGLRGSRIAAIAVISCFRLLDTMCSRMR